jgi:Protein of unknown function (DUF2958)
VLGYDGRADRLRLGLPRSAVERTFPRNATVKTLITDEQRAQLLANGQARVEGRQLDPQPVVKLFTLVIPCSDCAISA